MATRASLSAPSTASVPLLQKKLSEIGWDVPVLEGASGLACGRDFAVGYSPERINPGDKEHRFETIKKVVAGQTEKTLDIIADKNSRIKKLYKTLCITSSLEVDLLCNQDSGRIDHTRCTSHVTSRPDSEDTGSRWKPADRISGYYCVQRKATP